MYDVELEIRIHFVPVINLRNNINLYDIPVMVFVKLVTMLYIFVWKFS